MQVIQKNCYLCTFLTLNDMNLRDIKKDIDYVLSAFIEDCTVCAAVNPKSDDKVIAGLM